MIKYSAGSDLIWDYESQLVKSSSSSSFSTDAREKHVNEIETKLTNLRNFLSEWRLAYIDFCKTFDCFAIEEPFALKVKYEETLQNRVDELYQYPIHKDFYLNNFFDPILQNRCKNSIIEEPINILPEFCVETRKFKIINNFGSWCISKNRGYTDSYSVSFICSLMVVLINNPYIVYRWYKSPTFLNFIKQESKSIWSIQLDIGNKYFSSGNFRFSFFPSHITESSQIRIDYLNESFYFDIQGKHNYHHLDKIFGSDRKSKLTKEDLELYHMIHNRHPVLYDFEYS